MVQANRAIGTPSKIRPRKYQGLAIRKACGGPFDREDHGSRRKLRGKYCRPFNSDTKVRIEYPDHTRFYYPDALVVCYPNPSADHFQDQPVVIIEVLSGSTRRTDLGEKRDAYLTIPSLKVLILAESEAPAAIVHRRKSEGGFAVEAYSGLDEVIPLPEIDASLALADLYKQVEFSSPV